MRVKVKCSPKAAGSFPITRRCGTGRRCLISHPCDYCDTGSWDPTAKVCINRDTGTLSTFSMASSRALRCFFLCRRSACIFPLTVGSSRRMTFKCRSATSLGSFHGKVSYQSLSGGSGTCRERRICGKSELRSNSPEFLPHTTMTRAEWFGGIRDIWDSVICGSWYFGTGI